MKHKKKLKILLADDEKTIRITLGDDLKTAGHEVLDVGHGSDALQLVEEQTFDLVITHWGEGAARDDARRRIPAAVRLLTGIRTRDLRCPVVIFAAAEGAEQRTPIALGLGAQAYCFSFEGLYRTIERVLGTGEE